MGFEDYQVCLFLKSTLPLSITPAGNTVMSVGRAILSRWPQFAVDHKSMAYAPNFRPLLESYLVFTSSEGLFQCEITQIGNGLRISLRFAYCNPTTIYKPFCDVIQWAMTKYHLYCHVSRDLAPDQLHQTSDIYDATSVPDILLPSIDYNRRFWQLDVDSDEEKILSPEDALAYFVLKNRS